MLAYILIYGAIGYLIGLLIGNLLKLLADYLNKKGE